MDKEYLYWESFQRNIGIISYDDQIKLRNSRVSIAGMGGVGGIYLINMVRSGVGNFQIADPDKYEYRNINRQYGATVETIGKNKAEVMTSIAKSINSSVNIKIIANGLNDDNITDFISNSDIAIDAIDAYDLRLKSLFHETARNKKIYSIRSVPLGYGASMHIYSPYGASFDDMFNLESTKNTDEVFDKIMNVLSPNRLHERYLDADVYRKMTQGEERYSPPSFCPSVVLASSMVASEAVFILLGKKERPQESQCIVIDLLESTMEKHVMKSVE